MNNLNKLRPWSDDIQTLRKNKLKAIGKGQFSQVFDHPFDQGKVLIFSNDVTKEALADFINYDPYPNLPKLEKIGYIDKYDSYLYECPKYKKFTLKAMGKDFEKYAKVFEILKRVQTVYLGLKPAPHVYSLYKELQILDPKSFEYKIILGLYEWLNFMLSYDGDFKLDICRKNLAIDSDNNLIFLDPFFDYKAMIKKYR